MLIIWCLNIHFGNTVSTLLKELWWRHQMETFSMLLALCEENPLVVFGFPSQRPVTQSFDVCFDLCLNKCLTKQLRHRWFEMPSRSLWHHCNGIHFSIKCCTFITWFTFDTLVNHIHFLSFQAAMILTKHDTFIIKLCYATYITLCFHHEVHVCYDQENHGNKKPVGRKLRVY